MTLFPHEIVASQRSRRNDAHGSGQYGLTRRGGTKMHHGLDIIAHPTEKVFSPIEGEVVRESLPYKDDLSYRGLVIRGTKDWAGYEIKMFYLEGLFCGPVSPGTLIGHAQDISRRYPGITNHIHMEVRFRGQELSPMDLYRMCF